jgi:hypothetical protein
MEVFTKGFKVLVGAVTILVFSISLSNIEKLSGKQPVNPSPMFSQVHKIAVKNLAGNQGNIEKWGVKLSSPPDEPTFHPFICVTQAPNHCTDDPFFCYTADPLECTQDPFFCITFDPTIPECEYTQHPLNCVTQDPVECTQDPFFCYTEHPSYPECQFLTSEPIYCITYDPQYMCTIDPAYCYTYYPSIWPECEPTQADEGSLNPERSKLTIKNSPNPVKSFTVFEFTVTRSSRVKLEIFDLNGRLVSEVFNKQLNPGDYTVRWDGKDKRGNELPAGVYIYKLKTDREELSKKLILLK